MSAVGPEEQNIPVSQINMACYIQHKSDIHYEKWYAGDMEYAYRLLAAIIEAHPELDGHLEIVYV